MGGARDVASIAVFSAAIVGTNFALAGFPDVKLDAVMVFLATFTVGARVGASVAVISELVWSQVSPWGPSGGYLLPFLLTAELLYVLAGLVARRELGGQVKASEAGLLCAGALGVATFAWDLWTNVGTALLTTNLAPASVAFVAFNPLALEFSIMHEASNLVLGLSLVPAALVIVSRQMKRAALV